MAHTYDLRFNPSLESFLQSRSGDALTVLCGANNSGKSLTLKNCKLQLGESAYMLGAVRYYHVHQVGTGLRDPGQVRQLSEQFRQQFFQENFNYEQNFIDLNSILIGLKDSARSQWFDLAGKLLDAKVTLKKVDPANDLSMRYVDVDGRNLSVSSTGTRLLLTLLGICMDDRFDTLLIDEPELGLSPQVQQSLARFFQDESSRRAHFPHLKHIILATHSHLFLDRRSLANNFSVSKSDADVSIQKVSTVNELHRLQFNMLGNSLEDLHLPAAIVIVEGKTDHSYIERLVHLRFPGRRITVVPAQGDLKRAVHSLSALLGDLQTSPFRSRLFAVLDSVHDPSLQASLASLGMQRNNIVVWSKNGIEYVYPEDPLCGIFQASSQELLTMAIDGDVVSLNGISLRKKDLQEQVVSQLRDDTQLPPEVEERLLEPLAQSFGTG